MNPAHAGVATGPSGPQRFAIVDMKGVKRPSEGEPYDQVDLAKAVIWGASRGAGAFSTKYQLNREYLKETLESFDFCVSRHVARNTEV